MTELSFIEKIKILFQAVVSSRLFLVSTILGILLIVVMLLDMFKFKKLNKYFYLISWVLILVLIGIRYIGPLLKLTDNFIENIFKALYFPNYIVYTIILLLTNIYFFYTFFKKGIRKPFKILGIINFIVINLLFIIVLETIISDKISIYDELKIYTNSTLTVSLQLTTAFFTAMLLFYLLLSAHYKSKRFDKTGIKYNYKRSLPPIIFDDIEYEEPGKFTENDKVIVWKRIKRS